MGAGLGLGLDSGPQWGWRPLEVQELWGRGALSAHGHQPCSWEGRTQDGTIAPPGPTYQLRQHFLQLVHVHESQVLCLGLPDTADSRFCHHTGGR